MNLFLRVFQHLLPIRARAWNITIKKALRTFWESLTVIGVEFKAYADTVIYDDMYAQKTTLLNQWLIEYGLSDLSTSLSEQELRDRLASAWAEAGGQSPNYIQTTLQAAGFDVYVYDWWRPGFIILCGEEIALCGEPEALCGQTSESSVVIRPIVINPFDYLRPTYLSYGGGFTQCGEVDMECGEVVAQCGNTDELVAYPLVNKIAISSIDYNVLCGDSQALCGEPTALCGEFDGITETEQDYVIPSNSLYWHYFAYVGGHPFGELAEIPFTRKDEFERLCLKLFPSQLWLGILVKYV